MKKLSTIYLYGSFDRFNYGDILFSLLFKSWIENNPKLNQQYTIEYVSPFHGDETHKGGVKSISIKKAYNQINNHDILIVVGGDVLAVSWFLMYLHKFSADVKLRLVMKFFNLLRLNARKRTNTLINLRYGVGKLPLPYAIDKKNKKFKLIFTASGGSSLSKYGSKIFKESIEAADLFSVRDEQTKRLLNHDKVELIPDIAILLKELIFDKAPSKSVIFNLKDYFVFQIAKNYLKAEYKSVIIGELKKVIQQTGLKLLLLPIGTATGHEDHIALKDLQNDLPTEDTYFIENPDIQTIYNAMAHSRFFIGTSLHGAITSMTFYKPHFALDVGISKIQAYLNTWQIPPFDKPVTLDNLANTVSDYLNKPLPQKIYKEHIDRQKKMAWDFLQDCENVINNQEKQTMPAI